MLLRSIVSGAVTLYGLLHAVQAWQQQPEPLKTYLLLDSRNVQSSGGAELVLGPVRKHSTPVLTEQEKWEMRFDNMQPNVYWDHNKSTWRLWYSTMSECGGNVTGPGLDSRLPPDCQALPSNCSAAADPDWRWRDIRRAGAFAYAESSDGLEWKKPRLGLTEWPVGSGDKANNLISTFGMGSTGGAGTGILLDTSSASSQDEPVECTHWVTTNYSDCVEYRRGARPLHTTCGHPSRHLPDEVTLHACQTACAADTTCSIIQWQGAAAQNFSATAPGQCNLFARCVPSVYSGSHGADWCMEIEQCVRAAPRRPEPETKFKLFGEINSEPYFAESDDGLTYSQQRKVSIPHGRYDTHKNLVFDPATRRWIGYVRCSPSHNLRVQCYIESHTDNFTTTGWSSPMPTGLNTTTFYQPDALVAFHYAAADVWLGFANVCPGKAAWRRDGLPGQAPVGQVRGVLAWSPDARHWHYIAPEQSFIPLGRQASSGATPAFDCCGVFMAKQNPTVTAEYADGVADLPVYYAGSNGAFFGPRAGALGLVHVGKHAFAGLAGGPFVVTASAAQVQTGTLRVTASGAVRVAVAGVGRLSFAGCLPVNGTEVEVQWPNASSAPTSSVNGPTSMRQPLAEFVGGAVQLSFDVPAGSILYAYHV